MYDNGRLQRACLTLLRLGFVTLALVAASFAPSVRAQDANGLDGVGAVYHDLLDLFYRPLDPRELLQAGWTALTSDARRRGVAPPDPLAELPSDADAAFASFAGQYSNYVASLPPTFSASMSAAAIEDGMAASAHEQHTHYLSPASMQLFLSTVRGGQPSTGLGIRLGGDPPGLIVAVAPDGPAAIAGLRSGDVILGVDGQDLSHADTVALTNALGGAPGSVVRVSFDRGEGEQTLDVTRGAFYFPPLESRVLSDGVGYLRLSGFVIPGTTLPDGTELLADLDRRLDELDALGAQSLILDLRDNGGGSLQTTDELLGRFLPDTVRSVHEFDQRGHETYELASGRLHERQLPMVVLINGGSASASEITAAALRDAHRAVLVGQRTAGAVASSELLPLPGGAGLQVAVAAAGGGGSSAQLDGVGIVPDVAAAQARTLADYRSGHDPQIDVAMSALASAPAPPSVSPLPPAIGLADLDLMLEDALPISGEIPTNDRLSVTNRWQRMDFLHPNQVVDQNGGAPDPVALRQTLLGRGYQGSVFASYGSTPGDLPAVGVELDLYATARGAHDAVSTNDLSGMQQSIEAPVQTGDETVAYRGSWLATGSTFVGWRRGRVVLTVTYSDVPGFDRPATVAAIAQLVDARAQHLTVP